VVYVGTFSKNTFPGLRLGFAIAPPWLRPALLGVRVISDWHGSLLPQATLAAFITEGHLGRHVRRMRRSYAERWHELRRALSQHCAGWLSPLPCATGLHLAAELTREVDPERIAARCARHGVTVSPLRRFALGDCDRNGLVFGFGACLPETIDAAVKRVAAAQRR
jgi:GntR family transcriptional regulator/MocR family aminotransferase